MYAYFDGDNIGDSIELLLINANVKEATKLSVKLNDAIRQLKDELNDKLDIEIILYGGDDLLIKYDDVSDHLNIIQVARKNYFDCCGHYISCGCGDTLNIAMENLRKAKLMGRNHFIFNNTVIHEVKGRW